MLAPIYCSGKLWHDLIGKLKGKIKIPTTFNGEKVHKIGKSESISMAYNLVLVTISRRNINIKK